MFLLPGFFGGVIFNTIMKSSQLTNFITKVSLHLKTFFMQLKNKKEVEVISNALAKAESTCSMLEEMETSSLERVDREIVDNFKSLIEESESTLYSSVANSFIKTLKMNKETESQSSKKNGESSYAISDEDFAKIRHFIEKWENVKDFYRVEYFDFRKEVEAVPKIFLEVLQVIEKLVQITEKEQRIENIKRRISSFIEKATTSKEILLSSNFSFMSPYDFEEFVAKLFNKLGYNTITTSKTGDYGVDVIAENGFEKVAIQCKKYHEGNTVGNQTIQMLLGAMQLQGLKADRGVVVTTSHFTRQAYKQAEDNNVELWDKDILHQAVKKHFIGL